MFTVRPLFIVAGALLAFSTSLLAMDINDVIELKKADVGEEIILAQAQKEKAQFEFTTADFKKLKAAGVSDQLILTLMKSHTPPPAPPAEPTAAAPAAPATQCDLALEMMDETALEVAVNPQTYTILVARAGHLGAAADGINAWQLAPGKRLNVKIPAGRYTVQWDNDEEVVFTTAIDTTLATKLIFSQASTKLYDAIYLSVFRGDNRVDGGRLHMLHVNAAGFQPQTRVSGDDYTPAKAAQAQPIAVAEESRPAYTPVTVVRTQPIYVPQTVYVPQPVYVSPPVQYVYTRSYTPRCAPVYVPHYRYPSFCGPVRYTHYSSGHRYGSVRLGCDGLSLAFGGRNGSVRLNLGGHR